MTRKQYLDGIRVQIQQMQDHIDLLTKDVEKFEKVATKGRPPVRDLVRLVAERTKKSLADSHEVVAILEAHIKKVETEVPPDWMVYG